MSIYRTFIGITRLTVLWLGVSLFATDAGASVIPTPAGRAAPAAAAGAGTGQEGYRDRSSPCPRGAHSCGSRQVVITVGESAGRSQDAPIPDRRSGNVVPDLRAAAAIIYDPATGKVLYEENSQDERSIASITKVMTAVVFLESATDLNQEVQIVRSDTLRASTTYLGRTIGFASRICCTFC